MAIPHSQAIENINIFLLGGTDTNIATLYIYHYRTEQCALCIYPCLSILPIIM